MWPAPPWRPGPISSATSARSGRSDLDALRSGFGFLIYNFNPAKIFMGDCGSLSMGFTLGGQLSVLSTNTTAEASHLLHVPAGAGGGPGGAHLRHHPGFLSKGQPRPLHSPGRAGPFQSPPGLLGPQRAPGGAAALGHIGLRRTGLSCCWPATPNPLVAAVMIILLVLPLVFLRHISGRCKSL